MDPITLIALKLGAAFVPEILGKLTGSGKVEEVAGKVVDIAAGVTGIKDDPAKALEALQADAKLAQEFRVKVMDNDTELERIYAGDRASARKMQEAALGQDSWFAKNFIYIFASLWSIFAMVYFAAVTFCTIPQAGQRVADTILGVLIGSILGSIFQFFYGSSRGSQRKDDSIHAALTLK